MNGQHFIPKCWDPICDGGPAFSHGRCHKVSTQYPYGDTMLRHSIHTG